MEGTEREIGRVDLQNVLCLPTENVIVAHPLAMPIERVSCTIAFASSGECGIMTVYVGLFLLV